MAVVSETVETAAQRSVVWALSSDVLGTGRSALRCYERLGTPWKGVGG